MKKKIENSRKFFIFPMTLYLYIVLHNDFFRFPTVIRTSKLTLIHLTVLAILYTVLSVFLCLDVALLIIGSVDFKKCPIDEGVTYYLVMQGYTIQVLYYKHLTT